MTGKADFTEAEWKRLKRAPFIAGMAISLSDPGGPISLVKETAAALQVIAQAGDRGAFVAALSTEATAEARERHNPYGDFKAKGAQSAQEIVEEIGAVNRIVTLKADPEEAEAYRSWVWDAARGAANAAKEGGFLGIGAVLVSDRENEMLDRLEEALAKPKEE